MKLAARLTHLSLYLLLILLPVTGLIAWFGRSAAAGGVHAALTTALLILVGLHVAGALYQYLALKSGVMRRILRPER